MAEPVFLNGEIVDTEAVSVSVADRGLLLGEAAFETMRWTGEGLRRWPRHKARLISGLEYLGIPIPDLSEIEAAAAQLTAAAGLHEAVVRLTVSGGEGTGFERPEGVSPTVLMTVRPFTAPKPSLKLAFLPGARRAAVPSSRFKLSGYGDNLAARRLARARGADMAILSDGAGQPVCGDVANLFWVDHSGTIWTPALSAGALPGTTRAAILEAADAAGLTVSEASAHSPALSEAVAACVTNAVMGCVPASAIDDQALDANHPTLHQLITLERAAI